MSFKFSSEYKERTWRQVREKIIFKLCTSPRELSFISVGRPRLGTQPRVCDAHFTFPCLLETIHKSITLDQSSHIVTLAEFCRSKYFTILLRHCILGYIFLHKKWGLEDTFNFEGFS